MTSKPQNLKREGMFWKSFKIGGSPSYFFKDIIIKIDSSTYRLVEEKKIIMNLINNFYYKLHILNKKLGTMYILNRYHSTKVGERYL